MFLTFKGYVISAIKTSDGVSHLVSKVDDCILSSLFSRFVDVFLSFRMMLLR